METKSYTGIKVLALLVTIGFFFAFLNIENFGGLNRAVQFFGLNVQPPLSGIISMLTAFFLFVLTSLLWTRKGYALVIALFTYFTANYLIGAIVTLGMVFMSPGGGDTRSIVTAIVMLVFGLIYVFLTRYVMQNKSYFNA